MLISIFPTDNGSWSFAKQPGARPVRVKVPKGCALLEVKGWGVELFVPSEGDRRQRLAWSAGQVMREVRAGGGRFEVAGAKERVGA